MHRVNLMDALGLAACSGDEREDNTAKLEWKTRSIGTSDSSDQRYGLGTQGLSEPR